jgi:hypothetical protein
LPPGQKWLLVIQLFWCLGFTAHCLNARTPPAAPQRAGRYVHPGFLPFVPQHERNPVLPNDWRPALAMPKGIAASQHPAEVPAKSSIGIKTDPETTKVQAKQGSDSGPPITKNHPSRLNLSLPLRVAPSTPNPGENSSPCQNGPGTGHLEGGGGESARASHAGPSLSAHPPARALCGLAHLMSTMWRASCNSPEFPRKICRPGDRVSAVCFALGIADRSNAWCQLLGPGLPCAGFSPWRTVCYVES